MQSHVGAQLLGLVPVSLAKNLVGAALSIRLLCRGGRLA